MAKSNAGSRAKAVLGGKSKKSKTSKGKKPHEIHIRRGKSGGFIVRHSFKPEPGAQGVMPEDEEHVLPDVDSLQQHVGEAMADQPDQATPPPPPSPTGAAPAGM